MSLKNKISFTKEKEVSSYGADYTKQKIKDDLSKMIKAQLSDNAIYAILHDIAWAWTEQVDVNNGTKTKTAKLRGCKYWTKEALKIAFDINYCPIKGFDFDKHLRHEHIVPKIIFKETVLKYVKNNSFASNSQIQNLYNAMKNKLLGCVVTVDQAKKLDTKFAQKMPTPNDFLSISNPWERYEETKKDYPNDFTEICEVKWQQKGNTWIIVGEPTLFKKL